MNKFESHSLSTKITGRQALLLLNFPALIGPQARKIAAAQIAREAREEQAERRKQHRLVPPRVLNLRNAKTALLAKISRMIENLSVPLPPPRVQVSSTEPVVSSKPLVQEQHPPAVTNDTELEQAFPLVIASTGSSEMLGDEQFHTSVHSPTTQAWRRSILENERRAQALEQRRRNYWIG
jgi:hypothetical protein